MYACQDSSYRAIHLKKCIRVGGCPHKNREYNMNHFNTVLDGVKVAFSNHDVRGTPAYENINGAAWLDKLRKCPIGDKNGAHWIRATLNMDDSGKCLSRSNENASTISRVIIIDCDKSINSDGQEVDGAPDPIKVSNILMERGIAYVLHGSYSHYMNTKGNRYRILLITNSPYKKEHLAPTIESIITLINSDLFALKSDLLANAVENSTWAQSWYFPRQPIRNNFEPLYLEFLEGKLIDVSEPFLPPTHHIQYKNKSFDTNQISVIDAFNAQKNLEDFLKYYDFTQIRPQKWLSPNSSSGIPGITVKENKFFSHHNNIFNDGYWHDCFDLWRQMENLDFKSAITQASKIIYAPDGRTVDEYNKSVGNKKKREPILLPNTHPEVMKFDPNMLPEAMRGFIMDVANRQQSQPDFVAVAAIVGLSGLLGRKVLICPKQHDDWEVTPNQWGAIIGRPSAMKSPSMKAALQPLYKIELMAAKQHEEDKKNYDEEIQLLELEQSIAKEKAKKALKTSNREDAREALIMPDHPESPTRYRLIVNDATVEKLGELLNENPNGLIVVRDELAGLLFKLSKEEYQGDRAFYLECFDGNGHFTYDRIGRGTIEIKYCTLSIIGGIQPTKIAKLVSDAMKGIADDGLIQRFQLAIWPDDIGNWEWLDRAPDKIAQDAYYALFEEINSFQLHTNDGEPPRFRFTPEAQLLYIQWMEEIQSKARRQDIHPVIESHMLKMPQTIAGLALLFEILDGGRESVGVEATARALDWADYLLSHANRLYSIATNQSINNAQLIINRKNKPPHQFTARDVYRKNWAGLDTIEAVNEGIECLVDYYHLIPKEHLTTSTGGRPTISYEWNTIRD